MANLIYFDLYKSKYVFKYNENIYFYFSSPVYLEKFRQRISKFVESERNKFIYRYKIDEIDDLLFFLLYYCKIETRGFLVKINDIYYDNITSFKISIKN